MLQVVTVEGKTLHTGFTPTVGLRLDNPSPLRMVRAAIWSAVMDDPRFAAWALVQCSAASVEDLWMRYFAKGGDADPVEFEAYLYGLLDPASRDALILSWVVDEVLGL